MRLPLAVRGHVSMGGIGTLGIIDQRILPWTTTSVGSHKVLIVEL